LLNNIANSKDLDVLELHLTVDLAIPLATQAYSTEELSALLARASDLNDALGDGPQTFGLLRALYLLHLGRSDFVAALDLSDQAKRVCGEFVILTKDRAVAQTCASVEKR